MTRWLAIAHCLPGRTRLRSPLLRRDEPLGTRLADELSAVAGIREVRVRPYTGSVLIEHEPELTAGEIAERAALTLDVTRIVQVGEEPPAPPEAPPLSSLARKIAEAARTIDRDIRRASEGSVDLGTLATLGFFGAGAAQVVTTGKLPMPPWFNLAWWGFRTFMTVEGEEIAAVKQG